jgi:hypothetical protein
VPKPGASTGIKPVPAPAIKSGIKPVPAPAIKRPASVTPPVAKTPSEEKLEENKADANFAQQAEEHHEDTAKGEGEENA